ncbi:MAG TPA: glycosyltransferase, partial [Solirubrobacteraceae bacterium]|nr:glycosyltransferase [Solirubrobacteraceae bacterium]
TRPLRHLLAFLDGLSSEQRVRYIEAARALGERVVLTGRLEHDELADLLPACEALVVPSTFPEAFGMVAAEAAACGALPVSAAHSGLAEVSGALAEAVPSELAELLSFPVDDRAVRALAARVVGWLDADSDARERARAGLVETVRERWSWQGVARGVIAAARGELERLQRP